MMDLVDEVRLYDLKITAFPGRPMRLRPFVEFDTASHPQSGEAMALTIEKGTYRPARGGKPTFLEFSGHLEGEIENGVMEFEENRTTIARGRLAGASFQLTTLEDGKIASALQARQLFFELSSGRFVVPGGLGVELDSGSTFDVRDLKVTSAGHFSGVAKLDLAGKTGELSRQGATISASNIHVKTPGLTVVDGKATGPLQVTFDYQLEYPFVVKYPIAEIPEKRLDLDFHGPFAANLALKDAGKDSGEVTGTYVFKAPWDPIEQAALAALAAKWQQDLAIKHIDFAITPKMFRPCGETCFTLGHRGDGGEALVDEPAEEALLAVLRAGRQGQPRRRQAGARVHPQGRQDRDALQGRRRLGDQLPDALPDEDVQRDEALPDAAEPAAHRSIRCAAARSWSRSAVRSTGRRGSQSPRCLRSRSR